MEAKSLKNYIDAYQVKTKSKHDAKLLLAKLKSKDLPIDLVLLVEGNEVHGYIPCEIEKRIQNDDLGALWYYCEISDLINSVN